MIYKTIWEIIEVQKCRNKDLSANTLLWINIEKKFVPSVANIVWTDLSTYKIVKKWRFACNRMHVWRDRVLPISLSDIEEEFIVSPAYDVFAVKESEWVLSEYLMIRFLRKEFDKEARFYTDWDVRGWLPWESFCNIKIPVPSVDEQKKIVKRFNTIQNRINLNNSIIQKLEETAQTLYKHRFVDFEFPTLQNNSYANYKSSWGEMEYDNLIKDYIPKWWTCKNISELADITWWQCPDWENILDINTDKDAIDYCSWAGDMHWWFVVECTAKTDSPRKIAKDNDILMSVAGTVWKLCVADRDVCLWRATMWYSSKKKEYLMYLYLSLKEFSLDLSNNSWWSVQKIINTDNIKDLNIVFNENVVTDFSKFWNTIYNYLKNVSIQNKELNKLKYIFLTILC